MSVLSVRTGPAPRVLAALGSLMGAASAWATPPAAPQVTVGASDIKQLRFDWEIVPRSNYYELWFKANNGAPEVKFSESVPWRPAALTGVSAHLLDWNQARYRVKACNPSGCGSSAPIPVGGVLQDAVGHFKSSFTLDAAYFGWLVDVSEDGQTLVSAAPFESNDRNLQYPNAYLYVFHRDNGDWRFEARLFPLPASIDDGRDMSLSVSADGSRIAVGLPSYIANDNHGESGEVLIYRRGTGGWAVEQRIAPASGQLDEVGTTTQIDAAGDTLLVGRYAGGGAYDVYERSGSTWTLAHTIAAPGAINQQCDRATLSGDGLVVARACRFAGTPRIEVFAAPGWTRRNQLSPAAPGSNYIFGSIALDQTGNDLAAGFTVPDGGIGTRPVVYVYQRSTGEYASVATLKSGAWFADTSPNSYDGSRFGNALSFSRNGDFLAVGDTSDNGMGHGVFTPPLAPGAPYYGAVYLFERHVSSWGLRRVVKPKDQGHPYESWFGASVSLGDNGKVLAVGHPGESTLIQNPDNDQYDDHIQDGYGSGAIWIY